MRREKNGKSRSWWFDLTPRFLAMGANLRITWSYIILMPDCLNSSYSFDFPISPPEILQMTDFSADYSRISYDILFSFLWYLSQIKQSNRWPVSRSNVLHQLEHSFHCSKPLRNARSIRHPSRWSRDAWVRSKEVDIADVPFNKSECRLQSSLVSDVTLDEKYVLGSLIFVKAWA